MSVTNHLEDGSLRPIMTGEMTTEAEAARANLSPAIAEAKADRLLAGYHIWLDARTTELERARDLTPSEIAARLRELDNEHKNWAYLVIGSESMPRDFPLSDAERRAHHALIAAGRRGL